MNCFGLDFGRSAQPLALEPDSVLVLQPVSLSAVPGSGLASATVIATVAAKEFDLVQSSMLTLSFVGLGPVAGHPSLLFDFGLQQIVSVT